MPRPERSASSAPIASGFLAHSSASPSSSNTRTLSLAYFSFSCAGTPVSAIRPSFKKATRAHKRSASSMLCVVRKIVVPPSFISRSRRWMAAVVAGSSAAVGSSRNSSRGRCSTAMAKISLWRIPLESFFATRLPASARPTFSSTSPMREAGRPRRSANSFIFS